MSETVIVLINQVVIMFILMLAGFVLFKLGKIDEHGSSQLSYIVLNISTPLLILESMLVPFEKEKLYTSIVVFIITFMIHILIAACAKLVFHKGKYLEQFGIIFSNAGFLGIPLVRNVLGNEAVFYISIFCLVTNLLLWTYGVFLVSGDAKSVHFKKIMMSPCFLAIFIGIICFVCGIRFPDILNQSFHHLANLNTGLAMMVIGIYLAQTDFIKILKTRDVWFVCIFRLIVVPLIVILILWFIPISFDIKTVLLIGFATPVAGALAMFSQTYGADYSYGAGIIGISTLLSLLTMPVFVQLLTMI